MNLETLVLPLKTEDNAFRAGISRAIQMTSALVSGFAKAAVESVNLASDFAETVSKTNVVFGESAKEILAWGETAATAMGMSKNTALSAAGVFGNLFRAMKIGEKPSADMSKGLVKLAGDLASFNNMDPTEVLDKLRAGLSGETEPLRSLGVNLNQAMLEAKAFEMGLWDQKEALDAGAKAQAAYALIMEQTTLAQGDFARTSEGLANQQRILAAQWEDLKTKAGELLLPMFTEITAGANKLLTFLANPKFQSLDGLDSFLGDVIQTMSFKINAWASGDGPQELSDKLVSWIEKIGTGGEIDSKMLTAAQGLLDALVRAIGAIDWSAVWNAIDAQMDEWDAQIIETFQAWDESIIAGMSEADAAIIEQLNQWDADIVAGLQTLDANMTAGIRTGLDNVDAAFNEKLGKTKQSVSSWAAETNASFNTWASGVSASVTSGMSTLGTTIENKLREIAKTFFARGYGWTAQLIQGINSGTGGIIGTIQKLVGEINAVLRRILTTFNIQILFPGMDALGGASAGASLGGNKKNVDDNKIGGRASGGPVIAGQLYGINLDSEWFIPNENGRVEKKEEQRPAPGIDMERLGSVIATQVVKAMNNA